MNRKEEEETRGTKVAGKAFTINLQEDRTEVLTRRRRRNQRNQLHKACNWRKKDSLRNRSQHKSEDQHITTSTNSTQDQSTPTHEISTTGENSILTIGTRSKSVSQIKRRKIWFSISFHDNLSLVIPNNKKLDYWRLKVTFIAMLWWI